MTTKEACEIVDKVKAGEYHPRMIRTLASSVLSVEMLKARGEWRDGEISLNALLGVQSICRRNQDNETANLNRDYQRRSERYSGTKGLPSQE